MRIELAIDDEELDDVFQGRDPPTLGWVHGHTTSRLYGYLGDLPPSEFEGRFHATQQAATAWSKSK